jgi:hypothetical protein
MRKNAYEVIFIDGHSAEWWAFTAQQAIILAQALRIERGEIFDVADCKYLGPLPD